MRDFRPGRWLQAALLAAPLVLLVAWLASGAINRSQGPSIDSSTASPGPLAQEPRTRSQDGPLEAARSALALPAPEYDLPADRLEDRVDGAADYLRGLGCRRLIAWRLTAPPAELELLVFAGSEGAAAALARDAGKERDAGPGDEASVSDQAVLFRRGALYARLLADPEAPAQAGLLGELASRLDDALSRAPVVAADPASPGGLGG